MTCIFLSIGALSAYTTYLLCAMRYKCKASQDPKLAETVFNPRVVEKEIKEWRAKLREAFGIDEISSVSTTMEHMYGEAASIKEKAPIPSRYKSRQDPTKPKRG